jgi:PAS domain S-box-containing protein
VHLQNLFKHLRSFAKPLAKIMLAVFLGLLAFESAQDLLWPDLPKWQAHLIEVVYAAILAGTVGYFALRMHNVLYQQVLKENEKYKKSEEELRRSKEWFRSLTEHGSDLLTVIDQSGTILYESPSLERILGYRPIDRMGKSAFDLVHPEDLPRARSVLASAFQKLGSTHTIEMRVRGLDGRWHVFESTGQTMLDQHGKLCGVINSRDITERKRSEESLRESEQKFRSVIQSSPDAIVQADGSGTIIAWNTAAQKIFGYREEEVRGQPLTMLMPERYRDPHQKGIERMSSNGESRVIGSTVELHGLRKDGTEFPLDLSLGAWQTAEGTHYAGTIRDITERKQLEMRAGQLSRMAALGQLIGALAHAMKNPLFILTGRIQIAREKLAHQEYAALESDMKKIDEAGGRMQAIADRFMTIAKPVPPQQEQCSIQAILHKSLESLAKELTQNSIRVETAFAPDLPKIWSDPRQLYEVFLNLMQNAVQAMTHVPGARRLTVSADREGTWVVARIQDNGPGIAPEHRAGLFEPFFTAKREEQGTGLGLWIVRSTLMMLKGEVACESEVGKGTTFIVRLPVNAEESKP